jgi:hypothetical protein
VTFDNTILKDFAFANRDLFNSSAPVLAFKLCPGDADRYKYTVDLVNHRLFSTYQDHGNKQSMGFDVQLYSSMLTSDKVMQRCALMIYVLLDSEGSVVFLLTVCTKQHWECISCNV